MTIAAMETGQGAPGGTPFGRCQAAALTPLDGLLLPAWRAALASLRDAWPASADARQAAGMVAGIIAALAGMTVAEAARHAPDTLRAIADDAEAHPAFADMQAPTLAGIATAMAARAAT